MADNEHTESESPVSAHDAHLESVVARFEAEDRKTAETADDADDAEGSTSTETQPGEKKEHTPSNTESTTRDGETDEIEDDSDDSTGEDVDDADDDDQGTESDDDEEGTEGGEDDEDDSEENEDENEEGEGDADDEESGEDPEFKAALARHGTELTLEDVPEKYRPVVEAKIKKLEAGFTRAMQEARAFRTEQAQLRTERRYLTENTDLAIVELLQHGGDELMKKVNARLAKIDPSIDGNDEVSIADNKTVLDEVIKTRKQAASQAVRDELTDLESRYQRATEVETYANAAARKAGIAYSQAMEEVLAKRISDKPKEEWAKGLTNEEIDDVVALFARDHRRTQRSGARTDSKQRVIMRTELQRGKKDTVRPGKAATSAGVARPKKIVVDHNNQESRLAAMDESAKRILRKTGAGR
jgi:hypothetical protein